MEEALTGGGSGSPLHPLTKQEHSKMAYSEQYLPQAVQYGELGMEVFPVHPQTKAPLVSQYSASTNRWQIERWWFCYPDALIGHRLPEQEFILDVDPRHGGLDAWRLLLKEAGITSWAGRYHRSGRGDGGVHVWFRYPPDVDVRGISTRGLDVWARERGVGHPVLDGEGFPYRNRDGRVRWSAGIDLLHRDWRYTILPPSVHPASGRPYVWGEGVDRHVFPAEVPASILPVLTWNPPVSPPRQVRERSENFESVAEEYEDTTTWWEVLRPHGWDLVGGNGDEDGSAWRHPSATSSQSATITHGCLFVYSPNTPFEVTMSGLPRGYTRFHAYAVLEHGGDRSAASGYLWRVWRGLDPDDDLEIPRDVEELLEQMLLNGRGR